MHLIVIVLAEAVLGLIGFVIHLKKSHSQLARIFESNLNILEGRTERNLNMLEAKTEVDIKAIDDKVEAAIHLFIGNKS